MTTDGQPDVSEAEVEAARDAYYRAHWRNPVPPIAMRAALEAAARVRAGEAEPVATSLFEKLHIESLTRDWFDGPKPSVGGYLEVLQSRLRRAAPPAPISAIAVVERLGDQIAEAVHRGRYVPGGLPYTPLDKNLSGDRQYAERITRDVTKTILTALRAEASGETVWRPIASAPKKNEMRIMGWVRTSEHHIVTWFDKWTYDHRHPEAAETGGWIIGGGYVVFPIYWMPLPPPPESTT